MKKLKLKIVASVVFVFILFTCTGGVILSFMLPDNTVITKNETEGRWIPNHIGWLLTTRETPNEFVWQNNAKKISGSKTTINATVYLCGIIPLKNVNLSVTDTMTVMLGGQAVGINLKTNGVLVADVALIDTGHSHYSPAQKAGIKQGDIITKVNNNPVNTVKQISEIIKNSRGDIIFDGNRENKNMSWKVTPCADKSGNKKTGMWIRDSVSGIGTLTYYMPKSFGALGHPISDVDTGDFVEAGGGVVYSAKVIGIDKGEKGIPGSLKGVFSSEKIGNILANSPCGVFGSADITDGAEIMVCEKNEVKCDKAQIRCDIGNGPENFEAKIIRLLPASEGTKGMVIEITDQKLLDATGGIVQGMSGSPLIQNGKLIGAVTHVFVNDPTRGYGIFIENMLAEAENIK